MANTVHCSGFFMFMHEFRGKRNSKGWRYARNLLSYLTDLRNTSIKNLNIHNYKLSCSINLKTNLSSLLMFHIRHIDGKQDTEEGTESCSLSFCRRNIGIGGKLRATRKTKETLQLARHRRGS